MELGICPNCLHEMAHMDYLAPKNYKAKELTIPKTLYFCPWCEIISDDDENFNERLYRIPDNFACDKPTVKQKNTIYFINSKMHLGLRALTKAQCSRDIDKYFKIAASNQPMFEDSIRLK